MDARPEPKRHTERTRHREPSEREEPAPRTVPVDPFGSDPSGIPDPMPDDLQHSERADRAFDDAEPMEGDAPTG